MTTLDQHPPSCVRVQASVESMSPINPRPAALCRIPDVAIDAPCTHDIRGLMLDAEEVCARILLFSENLTLELWGALEGSWGCPCPYLLDHGLEPSAAD